MLAFVEITTWHWVGFICCVLILLAVDLGFFHKRAHVVRFREALTWTGVWFCLAMLFALWLQHFRTDKETLQFITGYLIELSLSMDNVFVIALIFGHFAIPSQFQHRVLFWGILGALIMRGLMIGAGVALVTRLHWVLYICGLFLLYSGFKTMFVKSDVDPSRSRVLRWTRRLFPVTPDLEGQKFLTRWQGRWALTPLALVLVMVEASDLVFAVDSIPAIFAVTTKPFIVFTSNVFAILGLRTLYFVLAGAISYFRYLKYGLSLVLVFIGIKMLLDPPDEGPKLFPFQVETPIGLWLIIVAGVILISMVLSVTAAYREKRQKQGAAAEPTAENSQVQKKPGE